LFAFKQIFFPGTSPGSPRDDPRSVAFRDRRLVSLPPIPAGLDVSFPPPLSEIKNQGFLYRVRGPIGGPFFFFTPESSLNTPGLRIGLFFTSKGWPRAWCISSEAMSPGVVGIMTLDHHPQSWRASVSRPVFPAPFFYPWYDDVPPSGPKDICRQLLPCLSPLPSRRDTLHVVSVFFFPWEPRLSSRTL